MTECGSMRTSGENEKQRSKEGRKGNELREKERKRKAEKKRNAGVWKRGNEERRLHRDQGRRSKL